MTYFSMIVLLYKDFKLLYNGCLYNTTFLTFFTSFVYVIWRLQIALQRLFILYNAHELLLYVCLSYTTFMTYFSMTILIRRLLVALERLFFLYNVYLSYSTFWFIQQRLACFTYRSKEALWDYSRSCWGTQSLGKGGLTVRPTFRRKTKLQIRIAATKNYYDNISRIPNNKRITA